MFDTYQPIYDATRSRLHDARGAIQEGAREAVGDQTQTVRMAVLEAMPVNLVEIIKEAVRESMPTATPVDLDIVFDAPPGHESGRFVEVESGGKSVIAGEWIHRPDGLWALHIRALAAKGGAK